MKKIILFLFFIFATEAVVAECAFSGMQFFPEQKEIGLQTMFIIQGYANSQETISSFSNRKIYLESENGNVIELKLREILKGQMHLTQALFSPTEQLEPNTTYFLKYSDQTEAETREMLQYNSQKKERERVHWKTTTKESLAMLNTDLKVEFEKTEVKQFGCGPSANAIFKVTPVSGTEIWYKTEVVDLQTDTTTIFYIQSREDKINVGHGMCSGAFTFNRKSNYKVRFTPTTIEGKELKKTEWKTFESPFANQRTLSGR